MECYEGATMIKTFRGLIADGGQDTILLHTNNGEIGYRIKKLQIMTNIPGTTQAEHVVKIYKILQASVDGVVDLNDNTLLAVAQYSQDSGSWVSSPLIMIMETEIFNQDIYITGIDVNSTSSVNYYLELEQFKLDINSNTIATLKDMRNTASPRP